MDTPAKKTCAVCFPTAQEVVAMREMTFTNFATPLETVATNMRIGGNAYLSHPYGYMSHAKTMNNAANSWDPMNIAS
ncbi:MAG: hypothetical protein QF535_17185 [Anaerolineales bacterium]|nr:hypothetical protein [Anaerolineales bacterium]